MLLVLLSYAQGQWLQPESPQPELQESVPKPARRRLRRSGNRVAAAYGRLPPLVLEPVWRLALRQPELLQAPVLPELAPLVLLLVLACEPPFFASVF